MPSYARLDGSNKPLVSPEAWTDMCAAPMDLIYQVAWQSFDLMLDHVERVEVSATWRLRVIAAALVLCIAFCAGGLVLVRRRVVRCRLRRALTRTIERLAQRRYVEPVAGGRNRDEFGMMSERLEALRQSGVEAERLAAEQIAGKDAELKRASTMETPPPPSAANSRPRSARCSTPSTPPAAK